MRLKETTKKSNAVKTATLPPLSGDLLRSLHISTPQSQPQPQHQLQQLHHPQLQHQQQHHHQQRCSSVGSTSSSGTCETDRSTHSTASACSALSPAAGMMPGLGAGGGEGLPPPGPGPSDEAAAVLAANIAESFTFLQQHAAHHFRDILYAAHMLGRGKEQRSCREVVGEGCHGGLVGGREGQVIGRSGARSVGLLHDQLLFWPTDCGAVRLVFCFSARPTFTLCRYLVAALHVALSAALHLPHSRSSLTRKSKFYKRFLKANTFISLQLTSFSNRSFWHSFSNSFSKLFTFTFFFKIFILKLQKRIFFILTFVFKVFIANDFILSVHFCF